MFELNDAKTPDGTVLIMGIQYEAQTSDKVWTYALIKTAGLWWVTGNAKAPVAAGWGAVKSWLERDGRVVLWVKSANSWADLYPAGTARMIVDEKTGEAAPHPSIDYSSPEEEECPDHPDNPGTGSCRFDSCRNCGGYHCGWWDCDSDTSQATEEPSYYDLPHR